MSMSKSVEDYVVEFSRYVDMLDHRNIEDTLEKLEKMKKSRKPKHMENYWKVVQCMGEIAIDSVARAVDNVQKSSCSCHTLQNLHQILRIMEECLISAAVIKRVLFYREDLLTALFVGIRQNEDPDLCRSCFRLLYRLLIVTKADFAQGYIKLGILKDCHAHIKCRVGLYGINPVTTVLYCTKIMWAISELCEKNTVNMVKRSKAYKELVNFVTTLRKAKTSGKLVTELYTFHVNMHMKFTMGQDDGQTVKAMWLPKEKLEEECGRFVEILRFCSSPSCRKQQTGEQKLRYCGDCKLARYCSEECQRVHWRSGHREKCLKKLSDKMER